MTQAVAGILGGLAAMPLLIAFRRELPGLRARRRARRRGGWLR